MIPSAGPVVDMGHAVRDVLAASFERVNSDGGIYGRGVANYATCVSIMALANDDPEKHAAAIAEAVKFVKARGLSGATALYDALKHAFDDPDMEAVYLLSDGAPSGGTIDDQAEIRGLVTEWNEERKVPIHCISAGQRHPLLVNLALDSGGEFREVD